MKRPYVTIKFAQTLDGRIAARDGSSKWISSAPARKMAHRLRAETDAVLVGINTVLKDDPSLTRRLVRGRNPARIVIDPQLRLPLNAKILKGNERAPTVIVTTPRAPAGKLAALQKKKAKFIILPPDKEGNIDITAIIGILYKIGIRKLLVEGGRGAITSFLRAGLADRIIAVIAPKLLGTGVEAVGDLGIRNIKGALKFRLSRAETAGADAVITLFKRSAKK